MKDVYYYWVIYRLSDGRESGQVFSGTFNEVLRKARRFASISTKSDGVKWNIIEIKRA